MTDTLDPQKLLLEEARAVSDLTPTQKLKTISIVIPTYKGEDYLRPLLDSLMMQRIPGYQFEVLLINSTSQDSVPEIASCYKRVRYHEIEQKKFSHPGTRNLAAAMTESDYIVFLTQDASPENPHWLYELVRPLEQQPQLAASYSRQIPRPRCNPLEARDVRTGAPLVDELRTLRSLQPWQMEEYQNNIAHFIRFSNVSACYRAGLLKEFPFDEKLKMVEDQEWSKRMLEKGHGIYYASKSVVVHSHEFNSSQIYQRHRDYGESFKRFMPAGKKPHSLKSAFWNIFQDYLLIVSCPGPLLWKIKWLVLSWPRRISAFWGFRIGWKRG